ncbi:MAG: pentapeptide repeat-containing protein [Campylobacterales bacterium]|nr:pentapeptide repeat-containing protein [Campylobacterales bacterium]
MILKKNQGKEYLENFIENTSNNKLRSKVEMIFQILPDNGRINLFTLFTSLFPNGSEENYSSQFSRFKNELNKELLSLKIPLKIVSEKKQKTPLTEKFAFFEEDESIKISNFEKEIEKFPRNLDEKVYTKNRGTSPNLYKIFVSYAAGDNRYVQELLSETEKFLNNIDESITFEIWKYNHKLLAGESIDGEIKEVIDKCDFGLLMISQNFINSNYIKTKELPHFVGENGKFALPVFIYKLEHNKYASLKEVEEKYFFQYNQKAYRDCRGKTKVDFASSLADSIYKSVIKGEMRREYKSAAEMVPFISCDEAKEQCDTKDFIATKARLINPEAVKDSEIHIGGNGVDVVSHITTWYQNSEGKKYFALLGDSGMGKTFSCMKVALDLIKLRKKNKSLPIPIYLDLRFFAGSTLIDKDFFIEEIIETVVKKSETRFSNYTSFIQIQKEIQRGNVFIIFDGLDEVLVHLEDKRRADSFIRELRKVAFIEDKDVYNKVLISCRTNYFPTLKEQFSLLSGNTREQDQKRDFEVLNLLPFKWEQVEEYCSKIGVDFFKFKDLITSIHNLEEMVTKPFTLKLITSQIKKLEEKQVAGRTVNSGTIYFNIIDEWLARDYGKHIFEESHKPRVMRDLSLFLWKEKTREIGYKKLDDWLYEWLMKYPSINNKYTGKKRDTLSNDLRTATFIVRPGIEKFMFAHTSLHEFFMAWGIFEKIVEEKFGELDFSLPSKETLDFLVDIFLDRKEEQEKFRENFPKIFQGEYSSKNLLGFEIFYLFSKRKIDLKGIVTLENENLEKREFHKIDLQNSQIKNCKINGAVFKKCNLSKGNFQNTSFNDTRFINTKLAKTNFTDTKLQYSKFKNSPTKDIVNLNKNQLGLKELERSLPKNIFQNIFLGHNERITSVTATSDGRYIVTGSYDRTAKIWEVESGECIKTIYNLGVKDSFVYDEILKKYTSFSGNGWEFCKYSDGKKSYYADEIEELKEVEL